MLNLFSLMYADDTVIFLQYMFISLETYYTEWKSTKQN